MKKKIIIAALTSALVLTSSGIVYQAYASDVTTTVPVENIVQDATTPVVAPQTEIKIAPDPNAQQIGVDLSEIPKGELILPETIVSPSSKATISSSISAPTLKQTSLNAKNLNNGLSFQATYQAQDGSEYVVLQNPIDTDANTTIGQIKDFYQEPVQDTELNGQPAVYVDGTARKVVHFFLKDRSVAVSTYTGTVEDALNVAKQIIEASSL
ncbi:hypothetical protein MKY96_25075 [Paenibacillus sp. FSL R7-0302]|uniref:hypothetical protein n=1 Tax=Paenibacillus sp. FSL R7-0302 TaxID=2921681 RepID=UPI0030F8F2CF